ncbi:MAG: glycosyltransferase [Promethearchaeota archaeon]
MNFVSIVVPTRNEEKKIEACLRSILNLDFPKEKYEILVIDGKSTDRTVEIASKYPVRIIENPKYKIGPAHNIGIKEAKGDIIVFTDADAQVDTHWLKFLVEHFSNPDVGCVIGGQTCIFGDRFISQIRAAFHDYYDAKMVHQLKRTPHEVTWKSMSTFGTAFLKEALVNVGGFDESIDYPDKDIGYRLSQKYKIIKDRRATIRHYLNKPFTKYCTQIFRASITEGILYRRYGVFLNKKSVLLTILVVVWLFGYLLSLTLLFLSLTHFIGALEILLIPLIGFIVYYFVKGFKINIRKKSGLKGIIGLPFVSFLSVLLRSFGIIRGLLKIDVKGIYKTIKSNDTV